MSCIAFYSIAVYNTRCCFTLFLQLFYFYLSMNIFSFNYIATWVICAAQNQERFRVDSNFVYKLALLSPAGWEAISN